MSLDETVRFFELRGERHEVAILLALGYRALALAERARQEDSP